MLRAIPAKVFYGIKYQIEILTHMIFIMILLSLNDRVSMSNPENERGGPTKLSHVQYSEVSVAHHSVHEFLKRTALVYGGVPDDRLK